jgi:hypothetical protein
MLLVRISDLVLNALRSDVTMAESTLPCFAALMPVIRGLAETAQDCDSSRIGATIAVPTLCLRPRCMERIIGVAIRSVNLRVPSGTGPRP